MSSMLLKLVVCLAASPLIGAETLSLRQAVALAIDGAGNLDVQLARESVAQSKAQAAGARALLLPMLALSTTEQNQARNLSAEGFRFADLPGFRIPAQVGPYNTFDARFALQQTVFNPSLFIRKKAFDLNTRAQQQTQLQTRELTAARVAHLYLNVLRHRSMLAGIQADLAFTTASLSIARETLAAGKAIPVDVTAALSDVRDVRIRELDERSELAKAQLNLLDLCNLDLTQTFDLADGGLPR